MKIVLTGGGSGGHITPLLAVAKELKHRHPHATIFYIGQRGDSLGDIPAEDPAIDAAYSVRAGKFRRYHNEGLRQLLDLPTVFKNVRDFFYVLSGIYQSRKLLKRLQPDVIFIKGGFVGVPVGLAAANLHIPYITHDSDSIPGLANRIISRWAAFHAVALPQDTYPYPQAKTITTGIPLQADFQPVTEAIRLKCRQELGISKDQLFLFIIGGGLGAQRINMAVAEALPNLLHQYPALSVAHVIGRANVETMAAMYQDKLSPKEQGRVAVLDYVKDVYRYSAAADVIVARAGATNLAEFALQGRACIIIPSPFLTGGHQLKNAAYLAEKQAALVVQEADLAADPNRLAHQVSQLLASPEKRQHLAKNLQAFAKPDATSDIAELIVSQIIRS